MNIDRMVLKVFVFFLLVSVLIFYFAIKARTILYDKPVFKFVSAKEFFDNYYNDSVILDLRDYEKYRALHANGAVHFSCDYLFETSLGIPRKIKQVERLIYTLSEAGISVDKNVGIFCDRIEDGMVLSAILSIFKVRGVYIIKDGFEQWQKQALPTTIKIKTISRGYIPFKLSKMFYENVIWDLNKTVENIDRVYKVGVSNSKIQLIPGSIYIKPKFDFDRFVVGSYYNSNDITKDKKILLYGSDNYEVLLAYFALVVYLEYPYVTIFNGGINEWMANNLPTK